ncbi:MAG: DUF2384 domain-containing protein [Hoeflea sp.]|uniref:type II RES/Xre toxin-antitoxin system antitoxin n=1 Tax=Hoeflea sp. TaxID=1940281 RepID=UPI0032ECD734
MAQFKKSDLAGSDSAKRGRMVKIAGGDGKYVNPGRLSEMRADRSAKPGVPFPQSRSDLNVIDTLKATGFSSTEIFGLVVSKRSLERRQQNNERLSPTETDRALRLLRIYEHGVRVFGSSEKTNRWLRKPCRALENAVPIDLLASETGAHIVETELHAIDQGMFA